MCGNLQSKICNRKWYNSYYGMAETICYTVGTARTEHPVTR